jgi:hypothetical protein
MAPLGQPQVADVDLTQFWDAWDKIAQEKGRLPYYTEAREFWASYDTKLTMSRDSIVDVRKSMELQTQWSSIDRFGMPRPEAASTAFYARVDAGTRSIQTWLNGGTSTVRDRFAELVRRLPEDFGAVEGHRNWLLGQDKVVGAVAVPAKVSVTVPTLAKISEQDRARVQVPVSNADQVLLAVDDAVRRRDELVGLFRQLTDDLNRLPHNEKWAGPTALAAEAPPGGSPVPGGGPVSGGPGGAPGGSGLAAATPATAPGMPTAPGLDGSGASSSTGPVASEPQVSAAAPSVDQSSADLPGGPVSAPAVDQSGLDDTSTTGLPPVDPELAATPTATMTPATTSTPATTPTTPLPGSIPSTPTGVSGFTGNPGASPVLSPFPLTSTRSSPSLSPAGPLTRRDGVGSSGPGASGSDADGPRGAPVIEESPVRTRGGTAGANTGAGPGIYPPVVPPMVPPMGGAPGGSGIRPGEAEFAGGPNRQAGGRDSWRAGLRPQLLGRAAEHDEPGHFPPVRPLPDGEVLDEELWQVSDAAPAAAPEPPRRSRKWGPG